MLALMALRGPRLPGAIIPAVSPPGEGIDSAAAATSYDLQELHRVVCAGSPRREPLGLRQRGRISFFLHWRSKLRQWRKKKGAYHAAAGEPARNNVGIAPGINRAEEEKRAPTMLPQAQRLEIT